MRSTENVITTYHDSYIPTNNKCTGIKLGDKNIWNRLHSAMITVPTMGSNLYLKSIDEDSR